MQTTLDALLTTAGLRDVLQMSTNNYTLFAPTNVAWTAAMYAGSVDCTSDYYITAACESTQDLLTATNLKDILLSHGGHERPPTCVSVPLHCMCMSGEERILCGSCCTW
jgi:hypothetical protein